jgi:predicted SAM-dependent methyltransferase
MGPADSSLSNRSMTNNGAPCAPSGNSIVKKPVAVRALLKGSFFLVGLVRAFRGLGSDIRVLLGLVGRRRAIDAYLKSHQTTKLHIGASNSMLDGWLNTDVFPSQEGVVYLDATKRFPFNEATFDYIMAEHMIEHISYAEGQEMLSECFRILKPRGRVRFATPDLRVLINLHAQPRTLEQDQYLDWVTANMPEADECKSVFAINNAFRAWGHQFLYDQPTLKHALELQGFQDIVFYKPGVSGTSALTDLEAHGREIQAEHINEFETMVVEASKP